MSFDKRRNRELAAPMPQPHPERLLMLGGAWLAMVTMGILGMSALVHPERRLPLIDPLLEAIADMKQQERIFAPAPEDEKVDQTIDALSAVMIEQGSVAEPAEYLTDVMSLTNRASDAVAVASEIASSAPPAIAQEPAAQPVIETVPPMAQNDVPIWIYLAIAISCIAGSSIITLFLYKLTSPKSQASPSARKVNRRPTVAYSNISNTSTSPVKIPVVPVPPVAPLKISTPRIVQPPALKLEPVVDPQPAELPQRSRADYLAQLAHDAKQQRPKRLVDVMDVRRRNHLAPFS